MDQVISDGLDSYDGDLVDKSAAPIIKYTEPKEEGPYEWSEWTSCNASCGNGYRFRKYCNEKRCIKNASEVCHLKLCSKEKLMLGMMLSFKRYPMALHAANTGDTDALKMMLFRGNMFYTMLMDDEDLTPTDIIKKFVRLQFAFKSSGGVASLKSSEDSSETSSFDTRLKAKDYILMRLVDGDFDSIDFESLDPQERHLAKKIKHMIK